MLTMFGQRLLPRLGMCGKPKFGLDLVFKTEPSKNLTSVQTAFRQKLRAICIKCADKEHFKTRPKQSLAYGF